MDAGKMKDRITIQVKESPRVWMDLARVWSEVRPLFAKEVIERGDIEQNATHLMVIRMRSDLRSIARVLFKDRIYDIKSILPHYRYRDRLELTCEQLHEMNDTIAVMRSGKVVGQFNVVTMAQLPPREIACCIVDVKHSYEQAGIDAVTWQKKVNIDCELGEDIQQGDRIRLAELGDFFVTEAQPTKHFLSVVAMQEKRGAE